VSEPAAPPAFSPRVMLALVLVGVFAFAALTVLAAYAPDLRGREDVRAHALSRSAVGYAGAVILARSLGMPVVVSRSREPSLDRSVLVLTPGEAVEAAAPARFRRARHTLIVLPKWGIEPDPLRPGRVRKAGLSNGDVDFLRAYGGTVAVSNLDHAARPVLRGAGGPFGPETRLPLGPIDQLQTVSGAAWAPALTDEQGRVVLAYARAHPDVWLLADPDLLNNQGLANLDTARAGMAILAAARGDGGVVFDVTLNGFERGRGLGRMMLEPPWLAATLCALAAAALTGLQALARFGAPRRPERAFALGAGALVENAAGLFRMARKEPELAPAYAALTRAEAAQALGVADETALESLAARRGAGSPAALAREADAARTRDDLLAVARRLHDWKAEMTRGRR